MSELEIKIGTRGSPLALAQAKIIADKISLSWPNIKILIIPIKTSGDKNNIPFSSDPAGIKGMFTMELERALINHEIDIAVHSLKDLPVNVNEFLPLVSYSERESPFDSLVIGKTEGNIIGSSSLRRRLQLEKLYPEKQILPIRGNINTRLDKLDKGEYSALVLAEAGLKRLGYSERITKIFTPDEIMPAPAQGILACQGRKDENYFYLESVNDKDSEDCAKAERSFSRALNAGCNIPVGAYAEILGDELRLRGLYVDVESGKFYRGVKTGKRTQAELIGYELSKEIFL